MFVTHYPSKKRPFYAMDDPADPTFTLSFDLLFHGLEITTGGQRIHDYQQLLDKIAGAGHDRLKAWSNTWIPSNTACRRTEDSASVWSV